MLVSSTNKTDRHDITEILLKVALITIDQPTIKHELDSLNTHQTPFQYLIAISNMLDHMPRLANLCYETDANLK
jgi:hypothetical protein